MDFEGFTAEDFETFTIEGLDARMEAIRQRIQPKFRSIGERLCAELSARAGTEMHLHIARHARRTVNPPQDTWLAIGPDKRGYKKLPHFQVGLFDDRVFIWLAMIYEIRNKKETADILLEHIPDIRRQLGKEDWVVSFDHTEKEAVPAGSLSADDWRRAFERFRDVKKAELLFGKQLPADHPAVQNGDRFLRLAEHTLHELMPIYRLITRTEQVEPRGKEIVTVR